ncbi:hypothetical protein [Colwellia piezophila]|uniref:hypothetical protein n=1 Tax=Colwellia piezophila TaxID=211668 RepID=UPI0003814784|nr:hypothetical protein [Colwellia piezophila]
MQAVTQGAGLRIRPIMMTGGMASAMLLTLLVQPTLFYLWRASGLKDINAN